MAAPASKALKQARLEIETYKANEITFGEAVKRRDEEIETLKKNIEGGNTTLNAFAAEKNELAKKLSNVECENVNLRRQVVSLERMNAIQDGYIQRTNESEYVAAIGAAVETQTPSPSPVRNGPILTPLIVENFDGSISSSSSRNFYRRS